jgi:Tfp pilus assembly protein PilN
MRRPAQAVSLNFAGTDHRLLARVRLAFVVVIILLAAAGGGLFWQVQAAGARTAGVERQIQELSTSEEKLRPALEERQQIVRNLGAMTALIEARRFNWTRLLTGIEEAFPGGIALSRVEFSAKDRAVSLEGVAQSPEALSALMIGLGRSSSFKSPLLKRQSMDKGILSFNVTVAYHESVAPGRPQEPVRRQGR